MAARLRQRVVGVNMTAMIDITFLLLIFLLVSASFVREGQIYSQLPVDDYHSMLIPIRLRVEERAGAPVIMVNNVNGFASLDDHQRVHVRVDGAEGSQPLSEYLTEMAEHGFSREMTPVTIEPADSAQWQYVLAAYNSVVAAGYHQISWKVAR